MDLSWLRVCATEQSVGCVQQVQLLYLALVVVGAVLVGVMAVRTRDLSTATLALMPVAIAIDIAVGALVVALRLPIYLDSIGTVLVGVLAGPWAGALTGLLADLVWATLPVPGGAGPGTAFFAPVAGVIGLMAGFWASQGVFRLRADDDRAGRFLALAGGAAAALVAFVAIQQTVGLPSLAVEDPAQLSANQSAFVTIALACVVLGAVVAWLTAQTVFRFRGPSPTVNAYLAVATGGAAFVLVLAVLRLLFAPAGWFAAVDGSDPDGDGPLGPILGGADLRGLAAPDPAGLVAAVAIAAVAGWVAWRWARRGDNARLFPVWVGGLTTGIVAATIAAPIAGGVFGGVTGSGADLVVAAYRTLGLNVFQSAFAQGLTSDPLDKTVSYTVVFAVLAALPLSVRTMFSRGESAVAD